MIQLVMYDVSRCNVKANVQLSNDRCYITIIKEQILYKMIPSVIPCSHNPWGPLVDDGFVYILQTVHKMSILMTGLLQCLLHCTNLKE